MPNIIAENANIILAAGTQTRWNRELIDGVPTIKQLVQVKGEILIERIQRQFPNSTVVTRDISIQLHSKKTFDPQFSETTIETLFSTNDLWRDWTTILLGDVDYGEHTVLKIQKQKEPIMFYGGERDIDGIAKEIFAVKWHRSNSTAVLMGINRLANNKEWTRRYGKLWNLYRQLNKIDFRVHEIKDFFTFVNDSRDFDTQKSYQRYATKQKI